MPHPAVTTIRRWLRCRLPILLGTAGAKKVGYLGFDREIDDSLFASYGKRKETSQRLLTALDRMAGDPSLPESFSLLDIGCGPGAIAHLIDRDDRLRRRVAYTGIDQSRSAIAYCTATWPQYRFEVRDALHDGLPADRFDVIMINGVTEHMPHYRDIVAAALAKKPTVFVLTSFGVIPQYDRDRRLWRPDMQCFMNSYAFMNVYRFLREQTTGEIHLSDFGDLERSRYWFPRKTELMFYVRNTAASSRAGESVEHSAA